MSNFFRQMHKLFDFPPDNAVSSLSSAFGLKIVDEVKFLEIPKFFQKTLLEECIICIIFGLFFIDRYRGLF